MPKGLEDLKIGLEQAKAAADAYTNDPAQPALLLDAQVAFGVVRRDTKPCSRLWGNRRR